MNLQVLQENLSKALSITLRFTKTKTQLPILSNTLFVASKNKLTLSATNLESSIAINLGAKVKSTGSVTLPANTITSVVSNLQGGTVTIKSSKEKVKLSNNSFSSMVLGTNSADFPSVPDKLTGTKLRIKSSDLISALKSCIYALSIDETRPILTGMLLVITKSNITFVGTDGFRLSKFELPNKSKVEKSVILPKNVLLELLRLSAGEDYVEISLSTKESLAVFGIGDITLSSRIIQGKYPDFEKIIPKSSDVIIELDKEELLRAIKLAGVFAKESANTIKFLIKKDSVQIKAKSSKSGSQEMSVDAKVTGNKSNKLEIAFNYKFIEDLLGSIDGGVIKVNLTDASSPVVFLDPENKNFLHLIMPVKL